MREVTITAVRYNPILRRQVVVRLTYNVGEGPRSDIVRWFLVREEMLKLQDSQDLILSRGPSQPNPAAQREAAPKF
jgi:ribosomal protein S24E